jgi:hypothetical protein
MMRPQQVADSACQQKPVQVNGGKVALLLHGP